MDSKTGIFRSRATSSHSLNLSKSLHASPPRSPPSQHNDRHWHRAGAPVWGTRSGQTPGPACSPSARSEGAPVHRADPARSRPAPAVPGIPRVSPYGAPRAVPGCIRLSGAQARRRGGVCCRGIRAGVWASPRECGWGPRTISQVAHRKFGILRSRRFREECPGRTRDL